MELGFVFVVMVYNGEIEIDELGLMVRDFGTDEDEVVDFFDGVDDDRLLSEFMAVVRTGVAVMDASRDVEDDGLSGFISLSDEVGLSNEAQELLGDKEEVMELIRSNDKHRDRFDVSFARGFNAGHELDIETGSGDEADKERDALFESFVLDDEDFTDSVMYLLEEMASSTGDSVEFHGGNDAHGEGRGEFVIELSDIPGKIVVESCDREITRSEIQESMDMGLSYREADYGVLIARTRDQLPESFDALNEFDRYLVVSLTENDSPDLDALRSAYRWARIRVFEENVEFIGNTGDNISIP